MQLSRELHTLLFQLLPLLHVTAQLQLLLPGLVDEAFQHLDLVLLVLDQFAVQFYLVGSCMSNISTSEFNSVYFMAALIHQSNGIRKQERTQPNLFAK